MNGALYNPLLGERIADELGGWYSSDGLTLYRTIETPGATLAALVGPHGEPLYATPNAALRPPAPPATEPAEVVELRARLAEAESQRDGLARKLEAAAALIDRFQVEMEPCRRALEQLSRSDAEIAATQAVLVRADLPPASRVAIAVAIHATGAYRVAAAFGGDEGAEAAPSRIEIASIAATIGVSARTIGSALIAADNLGILSRKAETCPESFADGSMQYKTIVRLGPPIAVAAAPAARRPPRARASSASSAGAAKSPPECAAKSPPECAACDTPMVPVQWACPRCDAQIDTPPESGVEKQHTIYAIANGVEKQHTTLVGPAAGANAGDGDRAMLPPADPCGSCGRRAWVPAPYDRSRYICARCGVEAF
jgi:hypothetical protein